MKIYLGLVVTGIYISISLFCIILIGCEQKHELGDLKMTQMEIEINKDGIKALASKKIFFGHASVGYNILAGIKEITGNQDDFMSINIKETNKFDEINEPAIYHSINGKNGFPKLKCDNFKNLLIDKNLGEKLDIAFFKFCYVDFNDTSDIQEIFDYYSNTIIEIKSRYPHLKILHVTSPLYAYSFTFKSKIKNFLLGDISNIKRNQYNNLLKDKFKTVDRIYDLALIESTKPSGEREIFTYKGDEYFSLVKSYTNDGGHLNKYGQFIAARGLLEVLTEMSVTN